MDGNERADDSASRGDYAAIVNPSLRYRIGGDAPDPVGIRADGPPLYAVHEISAWLHGAEFSVFVRGPMRRKDGHRGPSRGVRVDLTAEQPAWLSAVIADARRRLDADLSTSTEATGG